MFKCHLATFVDLGAIKHLRFLTFIPHVGGWTPDIDLDRYLYAVTAHLSNSSLTASLEEFTIGIYIVYHDYWVRGAAELLSRCSVWKDLDAIVSQLPPEVARACTHALYHSKLPTTLR
jgi:hypothetical protein